MFEKRKAAKQAEVEHQQVLANLRQMVETIPDAEGNVSMDSFARFIHAAKVAGVALNEHPDLRDPMLLGIAQNGYFIKVDHTLVLHDGETPLWETRAALLKEVTDHKYVGGSQGFSIPIGDHGVRYRVGQQRGHLVATGTHWTVGDQGALTLTDQRIVYHGDRKTLEFPLKKLATLSIYSDGLHLGVTTRQSTSTLRISDPIVFAGLIHAALDHLDKPITMVG
jgi:hypothetical protein